MTGVKPCPVILPGPGKVVLTTFHHASSDLIDLYLSPQPPTGLIATQQTAVEALLYPQVSRASVVDQAWERIGVTGNHPIWSEDRHDYVAAMDLRVGERLKNLSGDTVWVQQKLPRPGPTPVYNLEVQDEHVYYVGANGVLAHNSTECDAPRGAAVPTAYGTPFRQLSAKKIAQLEAKVADRSITKAEWKHLEWQRRLTDRRQAGTDAFWAQERQALSQGLAGSRNWNDAARQSILSGGQPRGIFSHHKYSVSQYPQLANDPSNILPVTFFEHFQKWHGGNWRSATHGVPLRPDLPDSF